MAVLDLKQKVTTRLPIEPVLLPNKIDYMYEGLCPVVLHSVELADQTDEKGEFEGITRKVLNITFTNYRPDGSIEPERFTTLSEKAIGTKMEVNGVPTLRPEADIETNNNDMYKRIKHILDGCQASPSFRDITAISEKELNDNFDLPAIVAAATPQEAAALRVAAYDKFFTFINNWFNGSTVGKVVTTSIFRNKDGVSIIQGWLKLLPAHPRKSYYTIPTWVSQGFFEYAAIDPQTKALRKAMVVKVKATESLKLVTKGDAFVNTENAMPGAVAGVSDSMNAFLRSQQGQ